MLLLIEENCDKIGRADENTKLGLCEESAGEMKLKELVQFRVQVLDTLIYKISKGWQV